MYFSLFMLSWNKMNCNRDFELAHHSWKMSQYYPVKCRPSSVWQKVCYFSPNADVSEKASCIVWQWWLWKQPVVLCGNLNVRQATS